MSTFPTPAELTASNFETLEDKASQPLKMVAILGTLAGVFIGLGGVFAITVLSGADAMPFGVAQLLSGLVFALGLVAVVIAGAELFTGNTLFFGSVAFGKLAFLPVMRVLGVAYLANFAGSLLLAVIVFLSGFHLGGDDAVAGAAVELAVTKGDKAFTTVFFSGVIANFLVCLGVWLALAGHTVSQRLLGLLMPVAAFVAGGFEHSVANMFLLPYGYIVQLGSDELSGIAMSSIVSNIAAATLGNILGGAIVGVTYGYLYLRDR
jgi:formate transporter